MAIAQRVRQHMQAASWIRGMFEQGLQLKQQHGADNVYDFSLGNPVRYQPSHGLPQRLIRIVTLRQEHRQGDERRIIAFTEIDLVVLEEVLDEFRRQQLGKWQTGRFSELALQRFDLADNRSLVTIRHCRPPCLNGFLKHHIQPCEAYFLTGQVLTDKVSAIPSRHLL